MKLSPEERNLLGQALDEKIWSLHRIGSPDSDPRVRAFRDLRERFRAARDADAPEAHQCRRDDDVAAWLKRRRDEFEQGKGSEADYWDILDNLLDDYRLHADTGTPLDTEVKGENV